MLAIQQSKQSHGSCTPNILPCRIHHNGRVNALKRYWNPTVTQDGKKISHFRGRKLHAKTMKLPKNYKGAVLLSTKRTLPMASTSAKEASEEEGFENDDDPAEEIRIMEERASFDEIIVWGHEASLDEASDPYIKGVEEWITFAEKLHAYPSPTNTSS